MLVAATLVDEKCTPFSSRVELARNSPRFVMLRDLSKPSMSMTAPHDYTPREHSSVDSI